MRSSASARDATGAASSTLPRLVSDTYAVGAVVPAKDMAAVVRETCTKEGGGWGQADSGGRGVGPHDGAGVSVGGCRVGQE